jgi:DNA-directed RNA polymerase subunit alpha
MSRTAISALFHDDDDQGHPPNQKTTEHSEPDDEHPIEVLELGMRTYNCLKRAGIHTVRRLLQMTLAELFTVRNLGPQGYDEIRNRLIACGFLPGNRPPGSSRETDPHHT